MKTVGELVEELLRAPQDAVPIIGGAVVIGVSLRRGTIRGDKAHQFRKDPNGEVHGLVFLAETAMANGAIKGTAR